MDEILGKTLGRYRVERLLGAGGMGAVYAGVQVDLGRPVAIKVLRAELAADESIVQRFKREAELAASLSHPHIAQVTDFGVEDGHAFLVMDLLEGESLADLLEREGRLDEVRAQRIGVQILTALAAAHDRGVVHRDLKPDNVFVQRVSGMELSKLLDFGIARMVDGDSKMTRTGTVLGTPAYMSPEQARGRAVDARSDIFGVGAVLYEALAGRRAFRGDNYHELMFAVVEQTPTPLTELDPGASPELAAVIARAMAKDPEARFATAAEMKDALEAITGLRDEAAGGPDTSADAYAPTMASEPSLDETEASGDGAADSISLAPTQAPTTEPLGSHDPSSPRTEEAGPGARAAPASGPRWPWVAIPLALLVGGGAVWAFTRPGDSERSERDAASAPASSAPRPEPAVEAEAETMRPLEPRAPDPEPPASEEAEPEEEPATSTETAASESEEGEPESEAGESANAAPRRRPRTTTVPCGASGAPRELALVTRRVGFRYSSLVPRGFRHTDAPTVRALARDTAPALGRCFRGHYADTGLDFDLAVAEGGRVTGVSLYQFCPVDPQAATCAERAMADAFTQIEGTGSGTLRVGFTRTRR